MACYGQAGSGKATLLRQVALELSKDSERPVYFLDHVPVSFRELIVALERINERGCILFTNSLDAVSEDIADVISNNILKRCVVVGSERENIWGRRTRATLQTYVGLSFHLERIDEEDAKSILVKIEEFGPWTRLARMSEDRRVRELVDKSRRQLLIGLMETTSGTGFEKIIENDYSRLSSDERQFLLLIGLATTHRAAMPQAIAVRGFRYFKTGYSFSAMFAMLKGIVRMDTRGALHVRHPVYARHLFEQVVDPDEVVAPVKALLSAFATYGSPVARFVGKEERYIFRSALNHRYLNDTLGGDPDKILDIYSSFERTYHSDGLYWLQYGLALRDLKRQEESLKCLQTAVVAYSSDQTKHALAQQYFIMANRITSRAKAMGYLEEALGRLKELGEISRAQDMYPVVTMAEGHTVPIRLSPIPTTSRVLPIPRVKLGLGRAAISPAMSSAS